MSKKITEMIEAHEDRIEDLTRMIQDELVAIRRLRALANQPDLPGLGDASERGAENGEAKLPTERL